LKQVVDNQLIGRLPYTVLYLKRLIEFYKSEQTAAVSNGEDKSENGNYLEKVSEKLLKYCGK